jgi:hypothetical protein
MRDIRILLLTVALTMLASRSIAAQDLAPGDSAQAQIRQTLRAFYFNLAHGDWEALTADILAAKVVAHRSPPAAQLSLNAGTPVCGNQNGPQVDQAAMALAEDWVEVFVPRCGAVPAGGDEFRMIHFEERWRFVAIHLFEELPLNFSTGP